MADNFEIGFSAKIDQSQYSNIRKEVEQMAKKLPELKLELTSADTITAIVNKFEQITKTVNGATTSVTKLGIEINGIQKNFQVSETVNNVKIVKDRMRELGQTMANLQTQVNQNLKQGSTSTANEIKQQIETVKKEFYELKKQLQKMPGQTNASAQTFANTVTARYNNTASKESSIAETAALKTYIQLLGQRNTAELNLIKTEYALETATDANRESLEQAQTLIKEKINRIEEQISASRKQITSTEGIEKAEEAAANATQDFAIQQANLKAKMDANREQAETLANIYKTQLVESGLRLVADAARAAYNEIIALNDAMTDVQMVTGGQATQTQNLAKEYSNLAQEYGATTVEVANGASEWLRQGKTAEETTELLKASLTMSKVGAIEQAEATELLTSTMNGYKMSVEEAMHVVDALSAVDLAAATSVEEIAKAMQKTQNIARTAGVSFEKLVGWIAQVSETTRQAPELIGTSFKSLFSRLENVAAGKDVDEYGESLNDSEKVLKKYGITMRNAEGDFRNMGDVIDEIAQKWDTLQKKEQDQISTAVAGTRQREIFQALMENYSRATELAVVATNSQGQAEEKMSIYTESLTAKMKALKASIDELIYDEDVVKFIGFIIDSIKGLIDLINKINSNPIGEMTLSFIAATTAVTGLVKAFNLLKTTNIFIMGISDAIKAVATATTGASVAAGTASASMLSLFTGPVGIAALAAGALLVLYKITDELHMWETTAEKVQRLTEELNTGKETAAEYSTKLDENKQKLIELNEIKSSSTNIDYINNEIAALEAENELLQAQLEIRQQLNKEQLAENAVANKDYSESLQEDLVGSYGEKIVKNDTRGITRKTDFSTAEMLQNKIDQNIEQIAKINESISRGEINQTKGIERYSNQIEELKKQTIEYRDALVNEYNTYSEMIENGVELTDEQKKRQEFIDKEMEGLSKIVGYGDEYLQINKKLSEVQNELNGTTDEGTAAKIAEELTTELDNTLSAFEQLNNVQKEMEETGYLQVATLQEMLSLYPELAESVSLYMMGLKEGNQLIAEMQALYQQDEQNYIALLSQKLENNAQYYNAVGLMDTEFINQMNEHYGVNLQGATTYAEARAMLEQELINRLGQAWAGYFSMMAEQQATLRATLGSGQDLAFFSNIEAAYKKLTDSFQSRVWENISYNFDAAKASIKGLTDATNEATQAAKRQEDAYNDLLKMVMDMLKQEAKNKRDALEDELDGYKKIIDARKKLLEQQKEERDYQKEIEEANKSIADLQNEIAALQFDTSREGIAKRLELEEELAEKQSELEDTQFEHSIDKQEEALDDEYSRFEEDINNRIDKIDEYLSQEGVIMREAMALINEHADSTFQRLLNWNMIWGTHTEQEMYDAWNFAKTQTNSYVQTVQSIPSTQPVGQDIFNNITMPTKEATQATYDLINARAQLANSVFYKQATTGALAGLSSISLNQAYDSLGRPGLIRKHHKGIDAGFVGNVKGNEMFVKALKGEAFITKYQQDKFMNSILPKMVSDNKDDTNSINTNIGTLLNVNVKGSVGDSEIKRIEESANMAIEKLNKGLFSRGRTRTTGQVSI